MGWSEVRWELGTPRGRRRLRTNHRFGRSFQVRFGADGVEVTTSIEDTVLFGAVDVFDTPADQLLAAVSR